jgi:hypothetical protein
VSRIDVELDNLRVALRWLVVRGEVELAQRLIGATRTVWISRSYLTEARGWLEAVLALDPPGPPRQPATRAKALLTMSGVALYQGDVAVARDAGLHSLELFEELRDTVRAVGALRFLALVASACADLASARRFSEQALVPARDTGQLAVLATTLSQLAELDLEEDDLEAAQRRAEEALKVANTAEHEGSVAESLPPLVQSTGASVEPTSLNAHTRRRWRVSAGQFSSTASLSASICPH